MQRYRCLGPGCKKWCQRGRVAFCSDECREKAMKIERLKAKGKKGQKHSNIPD